MSPSIVTLFPFSIIWFGIVVPSSLLNLTVKTSTSSFFSIHPAVNIKFELRKTTKNEDIYDVDATIYCLRESHKGIIIGKGGNLLKRISTYARQDIEKMLDTKVNLKVWVKVKEDWQEKDSIIKKFKNN